MCQGCDGGFVEKGAPFDAEVIHYKTGHTDLVTDHYVGGAECNDPEEGEEDVVECLHHFDCWLALMFLSSG